MKRVLVRYLDPADPGRTGAEEMVAIHPVDELRTTRELAGKAWADDQVRLEYQVWQALRRAGGVAGGDFESWLATVAEFEPRLSHSDVDAALAMGAVDEAGAAFMHGRVDELGDGQGESQAPPSL